MIPKHILNVCKIGQGKECCRYLVAGSKGLECGKLDATLRRVIDQRVHNMTAQADNCEGKTIEQLNDETKV